MLVVLRDAQPRPGLQPEAVLRELFRRGVEIADLEVAGAYLEDAFISLTTHKTNE